MRRHHARARATKSEVGGDIGAVGDLDNEKGILEKGAPKSNERKAREVREGRMHKKSGRYVVLRGQGAERKHGPRLEGIGNSGSAFMVEEDVMSDHEVSATILEHDMVRSRST